jgi:hypothetical protein
MTAIQTVCDSTHTLRSMCICRCVPRHMCRLAQSNRTRYCALSKEKMCILHSKEMLCTRVHTMDTVCASSQFKNLSVMSGGLQSRDKLAMCNCSQCTDILCDCTQSKHASYASSQSKQPIPRRCSSYNDIASTNITDEDDLSQYSGMSTDSIESVFVSDTDVYRKDKDRDQYSGISTTVLWKERVSAAISSDSGISLLSGVSVGFVTADKSTDEPMQDYLISADLEGRIDVHSEACPNLVSENVSAVNGECCNNDCAYISVDLFPKDSRTSMTEMYTHM